MNRYAQCLKQADEATARKRAIAKQTAHIWRDPFTYLDDTDTVYTKQGSIDRLRSKYKLRDLYYTAGYKRYEILTFLKMYNEAITHHIASENIRIIDRDEDKVVRLPRDLVKATPRTCAVCDSDTRSGIHALCDDCHERYTIQKKYHPLSFEYVTEAIWRSDIRHHAKVRDRAA